MKRGSKKAQSIFGMSFGVIFSIIIIVAIIGVASYAIVHFMGLSNCASVGLFFEDLQGEIDKAWTSETYRDRFVRGPPSGVKQVCFGNLEVEDFGSPHEPIRQDLNNKYPNIKANIFLYPPDKACDGEFFSFNLKHIPELDFECVKVKTDGKVTIQIEKDTEDPLVIIKE